MSEDHRVEPQPPASIRQNLARSQETLYQFLLEIVQCWSPDQVLAEFKHLFIHHTGTISSHTLPHLYEILFSNQEQEFRNTLKRSCYILVNNWEVTRNYQATQQLVQLFADPILYKPTESPTLKRLRTWLRNFIASSDFQDLKLFAARSSSKGTHWSHRYTSYLLVPQYADLQNSLEQRQAARTLCRQLREKFKLELAMYTAFEPSATLRKAHANPTQLGDEVLRLVKRIVAKRGPYSYANLARIFLNQTKNSDYGAFKQSLQDYLLFSLDHDPVAHILKKRLPEHLNSLYIDRHEETLNPTLMLQTALRLIDALTTETNQEPAGLFVLLLSQGNPIALVTVLLKLVLICRSCRTYLEVKIARLIQYYEQYSEDECQWVIRFFEMLNIALTIHTENVEYSLVNMTRVYQPSLNANRNSNLNANLEACRIFSQARTSNLLRRSHPS